MATNKTNTWLKRLPLVGRLFRNERGAVAVQFAILLLPLTVMSFGLFDISRASIAKQQLQDALDAATLLAARSSAVNDAGLQAVGQPALTANLSSLSDATLQSTTFHINGNFIDSSATVTVHPIIANLWMNGDMNVTANSQVVRTSNHAEVALVLDNTGSMGQTLGGQTKITALRTAAQGLVNTLSAAAIRSGDPNAVKIGVVPFSMTVNVGSTYRNASWITGVQPAAYGTDIFTTANTNRFTMFDNMAIGWGGCVESRPAPYDIQDTAPSVGNGATMFVPYFAPDEPDDNTIISGSGWWGTNYYSYNNNYINNDRNATTGSTLAAVQARQGSVAKYAVAYRGNILGGIGSGFGPNDGCAIAPIQRLTTDMTAVNTRLGQMVASGNTNVAMGLMWGWHVLSPNAPFADGSAYGTQHLIRVIVLLTDGDNTNNTSSDPNDSIYTGLGYIWQQRLLGSNNVALTDGSSSNDRMLAIDDRETRLCNNIRAQGILVYSIGVGVSAHSRSLLQACATDPSYYFDVTDAAQLNTVFDTIAGSIQNLRISH